MIRQFGSIRSFSTQAKPFRIAVVGSGPAGFYASHRLLKDCPNAYIDMYEKLPIPHGLVRYGVAPDHPEVKNVMTTFDKVAQDTRFRFFGNVAIGNDIKVDELKPHYHAILFSYGASTDRLLGIPNESVYGVESARSFVGWYNGLPDHRHLQLPLEDTDTAVVIGHGNVALDVARILLSPIDVLSKTDITEYALEALRKSRIRHVHVVGRRGPLQVAFTAKELREQMNLPGVSFHTDRDLVPRSISEASDYVNKSRPLKRLMQILQKGSAVQGDRSWTLDFLRSPSRITTLNDAGAQVNGITFQKNTLQGSPDQARAEPTAEEEHIPCGLVLRSIGYRSEPIPGIPFDARLGRVPNAYGAITAPDGSRLAGMYTAGWLKRGPTGVIVSTMADAYETADTIKDDLKEGRSMLECAGDGADSLAPLFAQRGLQPVSYADWKRIEAAEFMAGEKLGKPREKMSRIQDMLSQVSSS